MAFGALLGPAQIAAIEGAAEAALTSADAEKRQEAEKQLLPLQDAERTQTLCYLLSQAAGFYGRWFAANALRKLVSNDAAALARNPTLESGLWQWLLGFLTQRAPAAPGLERAVVAEVTGVLCVVARRHWVQDPQIRALPERLHAIFLQTAGLNAQMRAEGLRALGCLVNEMGYEVSTVGLTGMQPLLTYLSFRDQALSNVLACALQVLQGGPGIGVDQQVMTQALDCVTACYAFIDDGLGVPQAGGAGDPAADPATIQILFAVCRHFPGLLPGAAAAVSLAATAAKRKYGRHPGDPVRLRVWAEAALQFFADAIRGGSRCSELAELMRRLAEEGALAAVPPEEVHACLQLWLQWAPGDDVERMCAALPTWAAIGASSAQTGEAETSWAAGFVAARARFFGNAGAGELPEDCDLVAQGEGEGELLRRCGAATVFAALASQLQEQGQHQRGAAGLAWVIAAAAGCLSDRDPGRPHPLEAQPRTLWDVAGVVGTVHRLPAWAAAGAELQGAVLRAQLLFWEHCCGPLSAHPGPLRQLVHCAVQAVGGLAPAPGPPEHFDLPLLLQAVSTLRALLADGNAGEIAANLEDRACQTCLEHMPAAEAACCDLANVLLADVRAPVRLLMRLERLRGELQQLRQDDAASGAERAAALSALAAPAIARLRSSTVRDAAAGVHQLRGLFAACSSEWEGLWDLTHEHVAQLLQRGAASEDAVVRPLLRLAAEVCSGHVPRGSRAAQAAAAFAVHAVGAWMSAPAPAQRDWQNTWKVMTPCMQAVASVLSWGHAEMTQEAVSSRDTGAQSCGGHCLQIAVQLLRAPGPAELEQYAKLRAAHHRLAAAYFTAGGTEGAVQRLALAGPEAVGAVLQLVSPALGWAAADPGPIREAAVHAAQCAGGAARPQLVALWPNLPLADAALAALTQCCAGRSAAGRGCDPAVWRALTPLLAMQAEVVRQFAVQAAGCAAGQRPQRVGEELKHLLLALKSWGDATEGQERLQQESECSRRCAALAEAVREAL